MMLSATTVMEWDILAEIVLRVTIGVAVEVTKEVVAATIDLEVGVKMIELAITVAKKAIFHLIAHKAVVVEEGEEVDITTETEMVEMTEEAVMIIDHPQKYIMKFFGIKINFNTIINMVFIIILTITPKS